jgi:hypothetical protein
MFLRTKVLLMRQTLIEFFQKQIIEKLFEKRKETLVTSFHSSFFVNASTFI